MNLMGVVVLSSEASLTCLYGVRDPGENTRSPGVKVEKLRMVQRVCMCNVVVLIEFNRRGATPD